VNGLKMLVIVIAMRTSYDLDIAFWLDQVRIDGDKKTILVEALQTSEDAKSRARPRVH